MKKLNKNIVNVIVTIAKKGVKDDMNSTGSTWMFQPKIPQKVNDLKNKKK